MNSFKENDKKMDFLDKNRDIQYSDKQTTYDKNKNAVKFTGDIFSRVPVVGWIFNKTASSAEDLIDILTESSNSEEAIKRIEDSLSGKIQKAPNINEKLAIVLNLFIVAVTTGFTGVIIAIGIYGANFAIGKSKEAFDKLWWISLVRTNSLRVSYRIMRNQGWL